MRNIIFSCFFLFSLFTSPIENKISSPSKPIIVFDIGGVIASHNYQKIESFIQKELKISPKMTKKALEKWKRASIKGISSEVFWKKYARKHHLKLPKQWLPRLETTQLYAVEEVPGMIDLVIKLNGAGYHTAILSNTRPFKVESFKQRGIYDPFSTVVLCFTGEEKKPTDVSFQKLLEKTNALAANCIFIDDKPRNIEKAKQLGFDTILFTSPSDLVDALKQRNVLPEQ